MITRHRHHTAPHSGSRSVGSANHERVGVSSVRHGGLLCPAGSCTQQVSRGQRILSIKQHGRVSDTRIRTERIHKAMTEEEKMTTAGRELWFEKEMPAAAL